MNLGLISLIVLFAAIILGFLRNINVGILSIGFAMVLGLIYGISGKELISGFSSSLFLQMTGITYMFAVLSGNGTLSNLANRMVGLVGKRTYLIPFVMYIMGYVICAVGPGAIPSLAIIPVIAVPIAISAGINPVMLSLVGQVGVQSGRMSPLTPEALVVQELMAAQGIEVNTVVIGWCLLVTEFLLLVAIYVYYKGWRIDPNHKETERELKPFDKPQLVSLAGLIILLVGVLFFSWNVGLAGFLIGSVLVLLGAGDEKKSVQAVPWNVILMVLGVGILMNIITSSGGIDILVAGLEKLMTPKTATPILAVASGIMSFFSSGLGVVFPTLIPTTGGLAASLGINPVELCAAVVVGGTITGYSPISTAGALIMAAVSQEKEAEKKHPQNKMFVELFGVAFAGLFILALVTAAGVFGILC